MKQLLFLLILCLGLSAYGQDLIISEVSTDTDWVELHNPITNAPIDPTGYSVWVANNTVCPSAGASNGGYTILNPGAIVIPPGGYYLLQDLGAVAGDPPTVIQPSTGLPCPGERTFVNWSWTESSYGEVALYNPNGVGIDYMQWISHMAAGYPSLFFDEYYHNNPPDTLWLSGPIVRPTASLSHAFWRVNTGVAGAPSYLENDVNTDWFNAVSALLTPCDDNINLPSTQVLTRGVDLAVRENPTLSIDIAVDSPPSPGFPPEDMWILISTTQQPCAGTGPAFGLGVDALPGLFAPLGSITHPVLLPGTGPNNYLALATPGVLTTLGLTLDVRAIVWDPVTQSLALSNIVRCPDSLNPLNCP